MSKSLSERTIEDLENITMHLLQIRNIYELSPLKLSNKYLGIQIHAFGEMLRTETIRMQMIFGEYDGD